MYLFFDTETNGYPKGKLADDDPKQSIPVQVAAILTTAEGREMGSMNLIVHSGRPIPEEVVKIHGISEEIAKAYGVDPIQAVMTFEMLSENAEVFVAHNAPFDVKMMRYLKALVAGNERARKWGESIETFCTMQAAKDIVKIPPTHAMLASGRKTFKSPNLGECYQHFFGRPLEGAHDGMVDARACMDVFFAIKEHEEEAKSAAPVQRAMLPGGQPTEEEDLEIAAL